MRGILIVAHGSRQKETEHTLETIVEMVREMLPQTLIESAYMEFGLPNIDKGLERLVEQGVREIAVIPYFLFDGIHIHQDIPEEIARFCAKHPQVSVCTGKTLGADLRLAQVLCDRIRETL